MAPASKAATRAPVNETVAPEGWEQISEDFGEPLDWTPPVWDFAAEDGSRRLITDGTTFVGTFLGIKDIPDPDDDTKTIAVLNFLSEDGDKRYSWLTFQLEDTIKRAAVQAGDVLFIKCTGERSTKRGLNPVKTFDIRRKPRA